MRVWTVLCLVLVAAGWCRGDVINLTDGTKVEGKIHKTSEGWAVTQKDGSVVNVDADKVASIEASRSPDAVSVAEDRLASLRRVAEHLTDLQDIIGRYQRFLADLGDQKVAAEAQADLKIWQDRQERGMVKLGDQWISSEEREKRREQAQSEAIPARDLIANYKYKDAAKILSQAVTDDPECATAWYLQGVLLYKQDQVQGARKSFEAVNQIIPDHAPTLNNLAVIAWRQKSFVVAMNYYDHAMMAAPVAKEILDNVAEALNVVPPENRKAPVVLEGVKLFAEQDTELQKLAAQKGMYRWGATWVTASQLQELKAAEAKIKQQLDALQQQFDAIQMKIGQIDGEIDQNNREMTRLQSQSIFIDRNGNTIQMPLPDQYYQLKKDNDSLAQQKEPLAAQQQDLRNKAKDIQGGLPVPKYTGTQQLIGVDGTPVRGTMGSSPTTTASQAN
jgi:tetratricopeptide (TPR) repeat protein